MSESVYWMNGRCWTCGCPKVRETVRQSWCAGCGAEIGTIGWPPGDSPDADHQRVLGATYDAQHAEPAAPSPAPGAPRGGQGEGA